MSTYAKTINLIMIVVSILILLPVILLLAISVTDEQSFNQHGFQFIPSSFSLEGYSTFLQAPSQLLNAYFITIAVTVIGTIGAVLFNTMTAYVIARPDYRWKSITTFYIFLTMIFNGGLVPTYILITQYLQMNDTIWAMILPIMLSPFHIMIMKGFLSRIPYEIIESAKMDGAHEWRIFGSIVLPLSKPALATIGVITAFAYWNEYFLAFLYIDDKQLTPLQLLLVRVLDNIEFLKQNAFSGKVDIEISQMPTMSTRMALTVLVAGPMLVIFPFFQRYFVKGLTLGSLK